MSTFHKFPCRFKIYENKSFQQFVNYLLFWNHTLEMNLVLNGVQIAIMLVVQEYLQMDSCFLISHHGSCTEDTSFSVENDPWLYSYVGTTFLTCTKDGWFPDPPNNDKFPVGKDMRKFCWEQKSE